MKKTIILLSIVLATIASYSQDINKRKAVKRIKKDTTIRTVTYYDSLGNMIIFKKIKG